jgi:hypothetical protein
MGIVRCDVDRPSDLTLFLGRNPLTLDVIKQWQHNEDCRNACSQLQPDEVITRLNDLAGDVLNAGNRHVAEIRDLAVRGDSVAQVELEMLEDLANVDLQNAGLMRRPNAAHDPLEPRPPGEITREQRRQLTGWERDLSGLEEETGPDRFGRRRNDPNDGGIRGLQLISARENPPSTAFPPPRMLRRRVRAAPALLPRSEP